MLVLTGMRRGDSGREREGVWEPAGQSDRLSPANVAGTLFFFEGDSAGLSFVFFPAYARERAFEQRLLNYFGLFPSLF